MLYWNAILEEVLYKKFNRNFTFTNLIRDNQGEYKPKRRGKKRKQAKIYKLGKKFKGIHFSRREAECMVCFLQGKTIYGTAAAIGLSPRTVEYYVKNMKSKIGCHSKCELIEKVLQSSFLDNVDF